MHLSKEQYASLVRAVRDDISPSTPIPVPKTWKDTETGTLLLRIAEKELKWGKYYDLPLSKRNKLKKAYHLVQDGVFNAPDVKDKPEGGSQIREMIARVAIGSPKSRSSARSISVPNSLTSTVFERKRLLGKAQFECDVRRWSVLRSETEEDAEELYVGVTSMETIERSLKVQYGDCKGFGLIFFGENQTMDTFHFRYEDDPTFKLNFSKRFLC